MTASTRRRGRSLLSVLTAALLAVSGIALAPTIAMAEPTAQLAATLTPAEGSLTIQADVSNIPAASPGVYVAFIEAGTMANVDSSMKYAQLIKKADFVDQAGSATLVIEAADLDPAKSYELIAWPHMSFPNADNLYASAALTISQADWDVIFPVVNPAPQLAATLTPAEGSLTIQADVSNIPAASPGVYVAFIEAGTMANVDSSMKYAQLIKKADFVDQAGSATLVIEAADLDPAKSYELIAWPHMSFPNADNLYASAALTISQADWDVIFPAPVANPVLTVTPNADLDPAVENVLTVSGTGYVGAGAQFGAYVAFGEKDTWAGGGAFPATWPVQAWVPAAQVVDGAFTTTLTIPAGTLDASEEYVVASSAAHGLSVTDRTLDAFADVTVKQPAPVYDPQLTVAPNTGLDPAGETVTVTGEGYNPNVPIYVFQCANVDLPADLWSLATSCRTGAKVIYPQNETNPDRAKFDANGSFTVEFPVSAVAGGAGTAVYTAANHLAPTNRTQDAKAVLAFDAAHETTTKLSITPSAPILPKFGEEVTFTAQVAPTNAQGNVTFFVDGAQFGEPVSTALAVNGTVQLTTDELAAGSHEVTAEFTPVNANAFVGSESDAGSVLIAKAETTTTLAATPSSGVLGADVELTATVAPSVAGSVEFFSDGDSLGTVIVTDGQATLSTDALVAGSNEISAVFTSTDANYTGSESAPITVAIYDPQLTVTPNTGLDPTGASITVRGTGYNPNVPIYVTTCADVDLADVDFNFINNGCTAGAAAIGGRYPNQFAADGSFEVQMTVSPRANADATALYSIADHNARDNRTQDAKAVLAFDAAHATTTTLSVETATPVFGDSVTLKATIAPTAAAGSVTFAVDGESVGDPVTVSGGAATTTVAGLGAGDHEVTASFTSSNTKVYASSNAAAAEFEIAKAETETNLEATPANPVFGDAIELSASVDPAATGSVEFFRGADSLGQVALTDGAAATTVSGLGAGSYEFTAVYLGSDDYEGSTSDDVAVEIAKATPKVSLVAPATVKLGATTTLTAEIAPATAGTVTFFADGTQIGTPVDVVDGAAAIETEALDLAGYTFTAEFVPADAANYENAGAEQSVLTVDHSKASASVSVNGQSTTTVAPGDKVIFEAGQFAEGTEVSAEIHSDPIQLGTVTVGADGIARFNWTVPADFAGAHTLVVTADGVELSAPFTVTAANAGGSNGNSNGGANGAATGNGAGAGAVGATTASGLAHTGSDGIAGIAVAGMIILLAGGGLMMARRRQGSAQG